MANEAHIKAVITTEDKGSAALKRYGKNVEDLNGRVNHTLRNVALAGAAAGGAIVAFGISSVKAFTESQDAVAQTNAVLKSTGGVAGVTEKAVDGLSKSLQKVTRYSDEEVRGAENMLLTFTKIGKDIFPQATKTVLNMSTALGQDLKSSSIQLGKALQDPILGITALRRVGVNFSDKQKDVVKSLVETGRSAEAQKLILKELETEFGGSAEAAGTTFAGKLDILKNSLNDVQESIGSTIVDAITPFASKLSSFVASDKFQNWLSQVNEWIKVNLPVAINYITTEVWPALKSAFDTTWPIIKTITTNLSDLFVFIATHEAALWGFIAVFGALKLALALPGALAAFNAVMSAIRASYAVTAALINTPMVMPAIAVAAAIASIVAVINKYWEMRTAIDEAKVADEAAKYQHEKTHKYLLEKQKSGTPTQQKRATELLNKGYAQGGFTGKGSMNEVAGVVHKGEYVLPQSMVNQSTGTPNIGNTFNISINAGVMTGTDADMRKLSTMVADGLRQVASSKGMTPIQLLGGM